MRLTAIARTIFWWAVGVGAVVCVTDFFLDMIGLVPTEEICITET